MLKDVNISDKALYFKRLSNKKIEKEFEISKINQKKPFRKVLYRRYIFSEY